MKMESHRIPLRCTKPILGPVENLLKHMECSDKNVNPNQRNDAPTVRKLTSDARWESFIKFLAEDIPYDRGANSTVK